jgi:hypothetical protein
MPQTYDLPDSSFSGILDVDNSTFSWSLLSYNSSLISAVIDSFTGELTLSSVENANGSGDVVVSVSDGDTTKEFKINLFITRIEIVFSTVNIYKYLLKNENEQIYDLYELTSPDMENSLLSWSLQQDQDYSQLFDAGLSIFGSFTLKPKTDSAGFFQFIFEVSRNAASVNLIYFNITIINNYITYELNEGFGTEDVNIPAESYISLIQNFSFTYNLNNWNESFVKSAIISDTGIATLQSTSYVRGINSSPTMVITLEDITDPSQILYYSIIFNLTLSASVPRLLALASSPAIPVEESTLTPLQLRASYSGDSPYYLYVRKSQASGGIYLNFKYVNLYFNGIKIDLFDAYATSVREPFYPWLPIVYDNNIDAFSTNIGDNFYWRCKFFPVSGTSTDYTIQIIPANSVYTYLFDISITDPSTSAETTLLTLEDVVPDNLYSFTIDNNSDSLIQEYMITAISEGATLYDDAIKTNEINLYETVSDANLTVYFSPPAWNASGVLSEFTYKLISGDIISDESTIYVPVTPTYILCEIEFYVKKVSSLNTWAGDLKSTLEDGTIVSYFEGEELLNTFLGTTTWKISSIRDGAMVRTIDNYVRSLHSNTQYAYGLFYRLNKEGVSSEYKEINPSWRTQTQEEIRYFTDFAIDYSSLLDLSGSESRIPYFVCDIEFYVQINVAPGVATRLISTLEDGTEVNHFEGDVLLRSDGTDNSKIWKISSIQDSGSMVRSIYHTMYILPRQNPQNAGGLWYRILRDDDSTNWIDMNSTTYGEDIYTNFDNFMIDYSSLVATYGTDSRIDIAYGEPFITLDYNLGDASHTGLNAANNLWSIETYDSSFVNASIVENTGMLSLTSSVIGSGIIVVVVSEGDENPHKVVIRVTNAFTRIVTLDEYFSSFELDLVTGFNSISLVWELGSYDSSFILPEINTSSGLLTLSSVPYATGSGVIVVSVSDGDSANQKDISIQISVTPIYILCEIEFYVKKVSSLNTWAGDLKSTLEDGTIVSYFEGEELLNTFLGTTTWKISSIRDGAMVRTIDNYVRSSHNNTQNAYGLFYRFNKDGISTEYMELNSSWQTETLEEIRYFTDSAIDYSSILNYKADEESINYFESESRIPYFVCDIEFYVKDDIAPGIATRLISTLEDGTEVNHFEGEVTSAETVTFGGTVTYTHEGDVLERSEGTDSTKIWKISSIQDSGKMVRSIYHTMYIFPRTYQQDSGGLWYRLIRDGDSTNWIDMNSATYGQDIYTNFDNFMIDYSSLVAKYGEDSR